MKYKENYIPTAASLLTRTEVAIASAVNVGATSVTETVHEIVLVAGPTLSTALENNITT